MIAIIVGTNRTNALSKEIAQLYQNLLNERHIENEIIDLGELPKDFVFSALYENTGLNTEFNAFNEKINSADKFVFIVPEYNGSFPGVLKAFLDGLAYPGSFKGKKCAMVGISSGTQGAVIALSHLTDIFNYLGMHVLALKPKLARIEENWTEEVLQNKLYEELLHTQVEQLIKF